MINLATEKDCPVASTRLGKLEDGCVRYRQVASEPTFPFNRRRIQDQIPLWRDLAEADFAVPAERKVPPRSHPFAQNHLAKLLLLNEL